MRISKLDLFGFKSFPDRTGMHFGGGISCVVGPNGSGKSNVVDALKWVIGEQSAKSLRGADMQDVIFAGSIDRKPVGFAEVSLTLDAAEGEPFPGEYAQLQEIQVGRRLHRTGASEYLINQVRCRRRDVVDLFMDTGIGTNLYSFIEQGRVDKVVSASPQERRGLIDEAAGISRYKTRREEARSRLEATGQQLDRAADVADEMGRRLKVLERQVLKAAQFRRLRARVRQREVFLSLVKYQGYAADRRALQGGLREARSEEAAARRGLARREEDLRVRREEIVSVEAAARTWRDELAEVDARLRELTSQATLQEQRALEVHELAAVATAEVLECTVERESLDLQRQGLAGELAQTESALAEEGSSAVDRDARLEASKHIVESARDELRQAEGVWREALAEQARVQAEIQAVADRREVLPGQVVKLEAELAEVDRAVTEAEAGMADETATMAECEQGWLQASTVLNDAESALEERDAERLALRDEADGRLSVAMQAAATARSDLQDLQQALLDARDARERARDQALAEARQRRDDAFQQARNHGDAWVDGVAGEGERRLDEARVALEDLTDHWSALGSEAESDARKMAESDGERRLRAAEESIQQALHPIQAAERRAREATYESREALDQARVALAQAEVRVASLTAKVAAETRPDALASAKPLVDRLSPAEATKALLVWGPKAALPTLRDSTAVEAAVGALGPTESATLWWWRTEASEPVVHQAATLREALEMHAETGQAAVAPAARVEADGVVRVGVGDPAADRVRWRVERGEAEERAGSLSSDVDCLEGGLNTSEEALKHASEAVVDARTQAEHAMRDARRQAADHTRAAVQSALEALRLERDTAIDTAKDRVSTCREEADGANQHCRAARTSVLTDIQTVLDEAFANEAQAIRDAASSATGDEEALVMRQGTVQSTEAAVSALRGQALALPPREGHVDQVSSGRRGLQVATDLRTAAAAALARTGERQSGLDARRADVAMRLEGLREEFRSWTARGEDLAEALEQISLAVESTSAQHFLAVQVVEEETERHGAVASASLTADATRQAIRERLAGQKARLVELDARLAGLAARIEAASGRATDATSRHAEADTAAKSARVEMKGLGGGRAEAYDKLERERQRSKELGEGIREAESDLTKLRERLEAATRGTQELVDKSAAVRAEIETLREKMDERYQIGIPGLLDRLERAGKLLLEAEDEVAAGLEVGGITIEGVEPFELRPRGLEDEEAVLRSVAELDADRASLSRLGEVHLGALEEYTELAARHGDLDTQRADLEGSVSQLRAAIAKMNRTCREQFREAFDRVNENFQLSYPKLLGGGSARLALTDDEDLLETGVEIFVQPPGKRLQHLQLLSGGEKAMTAIALLIALFRVKPSPFCVLDEVDAPLDERNGGRFNTMLRELAATSQFVVITHNRKTMECADTLYGISMTKPGVSTLVTVTLADAVL